MQDDRAFREQVEACFGTREPTLYRDPARVAEKARDRLEMMANNGQFNSPRYRKFYKLYEAAKACAASASAAK